MNRHMPSNLSDKITKAEKDNTKLARHLWILPMFLKDKIDFCLINSCCVSVWKFFWSTHLITSWTPRFQCLRMMSAAVEFLVFVEVDQVDQQLLSNEIFHIKMSGRIIFMSNWVKNILLAAELTDGRRAEERWKHCACHNFSSVRPSTIF